MTSDLLLKLKEMEIEYKINMTIEITIAASCGGRCKGLSIKFPFLILDFAAAHKQQKESQ